MNEEEKLLLQQALDSFAVDNLLWSIVYLNNAIFNTPLKIDAQKKLLSMGKECKSIIMNIYPTENGKELVSAIEEYDRLFILYVNQLIHGSSQAPLIKERWKELGDGIAQLLSQINPHWNAMEWRAMINHESDLLDTLACGLHSKNYEIFFNTAPICRRLAFDMSSYMCNGIAKQY